MDEFKLGDAVTLKNGPYLNGVVIGHCGKTYNVMFDGNIEYNGLYYLDELHGSYKIMNNGHGEGFKISDYIPKGKRGGELLNRVSTVINGERSDSYGEPEDNFQNIADRWNQFFKTKYNAQFTITAADTALMMADLKIARELNSKVKDNIVDCIGYLTLRDGME